jgi:hypothetical protein
MLNRKSSLFTFFIFILLIQSAVAQKTNQTEIDWKDKLYEKDVKYEDFACRIEDNKTVFDFFKNRPLIRALSVCHNNCAILESFSNRKLPLLSPQVIGQGNIAIHILVNEEGRPLYARAVNGHPLMRTLLKTRACESKFKAMPDKRQQVILFCPNDSCRQFQPVFQLTKKVL